MEPLSIALNGTGRVLGGDGGGNLTNVQHKVIGNSYNEPPHMMNIC
jgi:hypothetical protein